MTPRLAPLLGMKEIKDTVRSQVRIGYDGRVHKLFRGTDADKRYENEKRVLKYLENRGCQFVPRVLDFDDERLYLVTTNCGHPVEAISEGKVKEIFDTLEKEYGVRHDDPFPRNITYSPNLGQFCVIDLELAEIVGQGNQEGESSDGVSDVAWAGLSRSGTRKPDNQDALIIFAAHAGGAAPLEMQTQADLKEGGIVFAVSDGLGGQGVGGLASKLCVSKVAKYLPARMGDFKGAGEPLEVLKAAVLDAHQEINRITIGKPGLESTAATLVCLWLLDHQMHFVHVGDSRLYRYREGELKQLSHDHTRVGRMFREGKINERESRTHPMRHVLQQVIGGQHQVVNPQVGSGGTRAGDWYLLCSDGLIDGLWNKNIAEIFAEAEQDHWSVVKTAEEFMERSGRISQEDDTTLFVVRLGRPPHSS